MSTAADFEPWYAVLDEVLAAVPTVRSVYAAHVAPNMSVDHPLLEHGATYFRGDVGAIGLLRPWYLMSMVASSQEPLGCCLPVTPENRPGEVHRRPRREAFCFVGCKNRFVAAAMGPSVSSYVTSLDDDHCRVAVAQVIAGLLRARVVPFEVASSTGHV